MVLVIAAVAVEPTLAGQWTDTSRLPGQASQDTAGDATPQPGRTVRPDRHETLTVGRERITVANRRLPPTAEMRDASPAGITQKRLRVGEGNVPDEPGGGASVQVTDG